MEDYKRVHMARSRYTERASFPGIEVYKSIYGWTDYWIGEHIIFSHRDSVYRISDLPDQLHSHEHYEMCLLIRGDVSYLSNDRKVPLAPGGLRIYAPGVLHTTKLDHETRYDRYILYFSKKAFPVPSTGSAAAGGTPAPDEALSPLLSFLQDHEICDLKVPPELEDQVYGLLSQLERALQTGGADVYYLAMSLLYRFFGLLNRHAVVTSERGSRIPENAVKVKRYIDENFRTINTTGDVAAHFFYTREYVARLFKEHYNTNLPDYVSRLKVQESKELLEQGMSVTEVCYASGFRNMSTFTETFKKRTHMTPSAYRREYNKKK